MKFSTQEVLDVPAAAAFALLTDFERFESVAARRGVEVRRTDALADPGVGLAWDATFEVRGRRRSISLQVVRYQPPDLLMLEFTSEGLRGETRVELISLGAEKTRAMISLEMRPATLAARLLLQSLKLAKSRLTRRYKARVGQYMEELERRYKRPV